MVSFAYYDNTWQSKSKFKNVFKLTNFVLTIKKMTPHSLSSQMDGLYPVFIHFNRMDQIDKGR